MCDPPFLKNIYEMQKKKEKKKKKKRIHRFICRTSTLSIMLYQ